MAFGKIIGQTMIVRNPCDRTITALHADGTWSFVVPRPYGGGTIIGGTKQPRDWDPHVSEETRREVQEKVARICPSLVTNGLPPTRGGFQVIRDIVGRRPARKGGMRVEVEVKPNRRLVHAYGAAGMGYEISWGVADEVARLVEQVEARAITAAKL
jgi:D-amino-acid oxidase